MTLRLSLHLSAAAFMGGSVLTFLLGGKEPGVWYAVGSGLGFVNLCFAAYLLSFGFRNIKNKATMIGLTLFKTMTFFLMLLVILMFLKPQLLPFTLGLGLIIVGTSVGALWEARRRRENPDGPEESGLPGVNTHEDYVG